MDVYSYGLLVCQIANDGKTPFDEMSNVERNTDTALELVLALLPHDTPAEMKKVVAATVKRTPQERANFEAIKGILKESKIWSEVLRYLSISISISIFRIN